MTQKLTVEQSFQKFVSNLNPTEKQRIRIQTNRETIDSVLANDKRIFLNTQQQPSFLTGSYRRNTIIRPIDDIDLYVRVHYGEHCVNKSPRSILLLIKYALCKKFGNRTEVKVDSPCVVVEFRDYKFEIVPVVGYENDSQLYNVPAPGSREWMQCYPNAPSKWLSSSNQVNNKMFIPLIKILKQWNRKNKIGLKSFHLELLTERVFNAITEIKSYPQGIFDWLYCVTIWISENNSPFIPEPGHAYKYVDEYLYQNRMQLTRMRKKLEMSLKKAERAYDFYVRGSNIAANRSYNNLFGSMFPSPEPMPAKPVLVPPKTEPALTIRDALLKQQPTGFLGGNPKNALLDALANSNPGVLGIPRSNAAKNCLLEALANPSPKPSETVSSGAIGTALSDLFSSPYNLFKK
ncbi:MAG: hypothetical protein JEZ02_18145 [Desulfatibacillum sp.]|nr:hypothetical protein [Desulfatibacillum sp.]